MGTNETSKPSFSLWIPLVWYLIVSTRSIARWLDESATEFSRADPDLVGSSLADKVVLFILIGLATAVLIRRREKLLAILRSNKWIVVLFIYMALSIAWSNFPEASLRRWVRSAGTLVMVLVVLTEANPLGSVTALLRRSYYIHLPLSIIAIKYFRSIGVHWSWDGKTEMWRGLAMHKNNLGQVAMSSGLFFFWHMFKNVGRNTNRILISDVIFCIMGLGLLGGSSTSYSGTSIASVAIGVCVLLGLQYIKTNIEYVRRLAVAWILVFGFVVSLLYVGLVTFNVEPMAVVLEVAGRDETLTGRTGLWTDILANASKHPILGVGYGAFWVGPVGYDLYPFPNWSEVTPGWRPNQGHNGYLDVYVDLGLGGVFLIIGVVAAAIRNIEQLLQTDFEAGRIRLVFLIALLFNNITESSLLHGTHSLWFLFLLFAINIPRWSESRQLQRT